MSYYAGEIVRLRDDFFRKFKDKAYFDAISGGEDIINLYKKNNNEESNEYATDLNNLAIAYDETGNFRKAIPLYEKAAEIKKKNSENGSESYADTLNNLGVALTRVGKHGAAVENHKKAYRMRRTILGEHHPDTVFSLYNLGNAYAETKNYQKALFYHKKAVASMEDEREFTDEDRADLFIAYGGSLMKTNNFRDGITYLNKGAELTKKIVGENSFTYVSLLIRIARDYEKAGCYREARDLYAKAMNLRVNIMDRKHFDYVYTLNMYCGVLEKLCEYEKIIDIQKDCQKYIDEITGKKHILYGDSIAKEARTYYNMGNLDKAEELAFKAVDIKKDSIGGANLEIGFADCYTILSRIYDKKGDLEKALEYNGKALDAKAGVLGKRGLYKAFSLLDRGYFFLHKKDLINADKYFDEALYEVHNSAAPNKYVYVKLIFKLADAYFDEGDRRKALETAMAGCEIAEKSVPESPLYAGSLYKKALMEFKCNKLELAYRDMTEALKLQEEIMGPDLSVVDVTKCALGEIYMAMGRNMEAVKIFEGLCSKGAGQSRAEKLMFARMKHLIAKCQEKMGNDDMCMIGYNLAVVTFEQFKLCDREEYMRLLTDYSEFMQKKGLFSDAGKLLERAVSAYEETGNAPLRNKAEIYKKIGDIYKESDIDGAIGAYEKRLELLKADSASSSAEIANAAMRIADMYVEDGNFSEAMKYSMEALSVVESKLGEGPEYAKILTHSAGQYIKWGKVDDAVLVLSRAADIYLGSKGPESAEYLETIEKKGLICFENNMHEKALPDLEKVYNIMLKKDKNLIKPEVLDAIKTICGERKDFIKLAKIKMGKEL
ncbi:MAG: tetratricopeptide repeat protein [Firmicutes bacterium]|nr:tetratricopeptide repeat protein [Bacillota bacterium]